VTGYSFGDTDLAAARLVVLDTVFAPSTDALLAAVDAETAVAPGRVADLGCGPGATTARLVRRFPAATVIGVDTSAAFLTAARAAVPTARFVDADVNRPLPDPPYDLVYARYLLAHLVETEHIASSDPTFARYESLSDARVAAAGANVYAGRAISAAIPPAAEVLVDRVIPLDLTAGQAASLFWRNLATWGHEAVEQGLIGEAARAALLTQLRDRVDDPTRGLFTWTHHQTALRRA
jgi:SAM-dependent methyltransferase